MLKAMNFHDYGLLTVLINADEEVSSAGSHSNNAEYIDTDSIEPRLYLLTRIVMDVAQGKTQ